MVGGEINYRCLGNDQYEIMVTVFRDCDTGVPWFDFKVVKTRYKAKAKQGL